MIKLKDLLIESVFDKSILKCVFLAGGPGSGKTYVTKGLFGIPESSVAVSSKYDMKLVSSDTAFEFLLKKYGFETFGTGKLDIDKWPEEVFIAATGADRSGKSHEDEESPSIRQKAKWMTKDKLKLYTEGRLGIIMDGTGHDYENIKKKKDKIEKLGYDTFMVFVNTSLKVALERNENRDRSLPKQVVTDSWEDVQDNLGKFQGLFKSNFRIVDNSKFLSEKQATAKFKSIMGQGIDKFVSKSVKNSIGIKWIAHQKALIKNKKRH